MLEVDGKLARRVAEEVWVQHREKRGCIVALSLHPPVGVGILSLHSEEVRGREVSPKRVRQMLWWERKRRVLERDNAAVWSVYDERTDTSHLGLGAIVGERAFRLGRERGLLGVLFYPSEEADAAEPQRA